MSQQLQKTESGDEKAVINTVKQTIFPTATDSELMLYFHKCTTLGVHPLSGMIHPMKFNSSEGPKVTFIVSIDLLRSRSTETGQYDGIDPPEYEGTYEQELPDNKGSITVPQTCTIKVYRKDVSRPFVGIARWAEFYPGDKKGHQWRQKPYLMLAKCAEAQARRLAFPAELNKLYTDEEMQATTEALAGVKEVSASTKPNVAPEQIVDNSTKESFLFGTVEAVSSKSGKSPSSGKDWTKFSVKINGVAYSTFSQSVGSIAATLVNKKVRFTATKDGNYSNILSIEECIENVMDTSDFGGYLKPMIAKAGLTESEFLAVLKNEFGYSSAADVPADKQQKIIDYLSFCAEA
jgi:phage recombination protein Bet